MANFDDLINRLTHKLRIDPELRMDVANELRAHLEDSVAEFRRGGYSEKEAAETAVKALGDETELAQNLWLANKKRIRIRQVIKWVARVTLIPAAIIVTLLIAYPGSNFLNLRNSIDWNTYVEKIQSQGLTEEQQFIYYGDPRAKTDLDCQKSIADRWPDNPVYYANFISIYLNANDERLISEKDPQAITQAIILLNHGQKLEPQNAFYNICKAAILLSRGSNLIDQSNYTYTIMDHKGNTSLKYCRKLKITDRRSMEEGFAELRIGAAKPYFTNHVADMAKIRLSFLSPPSNFMDYLARNTFIIGSILSPPHTLRMAAQTACAYAIELAEQGKKNEALAVINSVNILGPKIAAQTGTLVELLVGQAIYELALGHEINVYKILGLTQNENQASKELTNLNQFNQSIWKFDPNFQNGIKLNGGFMHNILTPALPGYRVNLEPMRKTEYAVYERIVLSYLLLSLDWLTIILAIVTLACWWKWRKQDNGPKLLFVGFRPLAILLFWAFMVPVGIYTIYYMFGLRTYGLYIALPRVLLEFILTVNIVLVLLLTLSYSAIRQCAQTAGISVPPVTGLRRRKWFILSGLVLGLCVLIYIVLWFDNARQANFGFLQSYRYTAILVLLIELTFIGWIIFELARLYRLPAIYGHFRRTLLRSLVPIFALTAITLGSLCGFLVTRAEASGLKNVEYFIDSEIRQSNFQLMKDRLTQQHKILLAEYLRQEEIKK